ncbi:MAG: hypothetical protein KF741_14160 [Ferruginibacter sp.]|nr:hypothetical protein [Ferruginibacter sp.]
MFNIQNPTFNIHNSSFIIHNSNHQGTTVEATVVQKLYQGAIPKTGCNRFRGSFFVTFLEKQKSKQEKLSFTQRNKSGKGAKPIRRWLSMVREPRRKKVKSQKSKGKSKKSIINVQNSTFACNKYFTQGKYLTNKKYG